LSAGEGRYDTQRFVNFPAVGTVATGKQKIDFLSSHLRAAYAFDFGDWYLRPLLDFGVSRTRLGAFSESGAGAANLNVQQQTETYVSVQPALEFGTEWAQSGGTLIRPFTALGVTHYLSGNNPQITASLQGVPAGVAPFTVNGEMDKTFGNLTLGVDFLARDGKNVRVSYDGQFSDHTESHAFSVKLSLPF
jgi:outer membrane autotransporter protein